MFADRYLTICTNKIRSTYKQRHVRQIDTYSYKYQYLIYSSLYTPKFREEKKNVFLKVFLLFNNAKNNRQRCIIVIKLYPKGRNLSLNS